MKPTLLILDDEKPFCRAAASHLASDTLNVVVAHDCKSGMRIYSEQKIDVVVLDQKLPDGLGSDLCRPILKQNEHAKIIFITAYPSFDNAVAALKQGAFDYLTKPFDLRELTHIIDRALRTTKLEKIELVERYHASKHEAAARLVGTSTEVDKTQQLLERAAASDASVLITGETGTGKNVVARALHYSSPRRDGPFITLNCAALPENLIEAELFGHTKGAFTGAQTLRRGVFEMTDGGTLLLDEIGSMPIELQPKLLSVLDDRSVRRIGGDSFLRVDVRVIAATNTTLTKAIKHGVFRQDLYYRLNVIRIQLPPLRERLADIPELCEHFIRELTPGRHIELADSELPLLIDYSWPGNIRELRNVIERAIALQDGPLITPSEFLHGGIHESTPPAQRAAGETQGFDEQKDAIMTLNELEKKHITSTLGMLSGNLARSARVLGISLNTLKRKMSRYGFR